MRWSDIGKRPARKSLDPHSDPVLDQEWYASSDGEPEERTGRSVSVTTPRGTFPSISAAAEAHGITRPTAVYRLKSGVWTANDERKTRDNGRLGQKHTDAAKAKVVAANVGKTFAGDTLRKLSATMRGRKASAETKEKMKASSTPKRAPRLPVITPNGTYPSVNAAAIAHGISAPAGLYRVKAGIWKLADGNA